MQKANLGNFYESSIDSQEGENGNVTNYVATGSISNENIVTTRDRAALVFHEYVRNREWTTDWLAYLSMAIGLLCTLMTAEFTGLKVKENVLIEGGVCKGLVVGVCLMAFIGALVCLVRRIYKRKSLTCEYFLGQLRKTNVNVD